MLNGKVFNNSFNSWIDRKDLFALKTTLKTEVDKLDIPKLITTPNDLAKLTIGVQEDFF